MKKCTLHEQFEDDEQYLTFREFVTALRNITGCQHGAMEVDGRTAVVDFLVPPHKTDDFDTVIGATVYDHCWEP